MTIKNIFKCSQDLFREGLVIETSITLDIISEQNL